MPKVSVIMPSYNKEKFISKAIDSILKQGFHDFELIIIDDVSTDNSVDIIRAYRDDRIRFYRNERNIGIAFNRNRGLDIAKGIYIALLDADDISPLWRLEKEVDFLDSHPEMDVVFGGFSEIDENDILKENYFSPLINPKFIKARLMVQDVVPNGSCMYRKSFVDKHNIRYRDGYLGMDDYLFWVECSLHGNITSIPDKLLYWRNIKENNTTLYQHSEKYRDKRIQKHAEIQKYALIGNGFALSDDELQLYSKILGENLYKIETQTELSQFYQLIKKLCAQAEKMDNVKEICKMYKKQFGQSLVNSYIWDN